MNKTASADIEDALLTRLVSVYKAKGINMQKILDNPLFQQLPLPKKIAFIEQVGGPLSEKPKYGWSNPLGGALGGVMGGAMATGLAAVKSGVSPQAMSRSVILGMMGGGAIGLLGGAIKGRMDLSNDRRTQSYTDPYDTLINRVQVTSPKYAISNNKYLNKLDNMTESIIPRMAINLGKL